MTMMAGDSENFYDPSSKNLAKAIASEDPDSVGSMCILMQCHASKR